MTVTDRPDDAFDKKTEAVLETYRRAFSKALFRELEKKAEKIRQNRPKRTTKLTDFICNSCEDTPSIPSKANRIHELVRKGDIAFMPKTANNPQKNETKLYYEDELRQVWPKLREKVKSLPKLKD